LWGREKTSAVKIETRAVSSVIGGAKKKLRRGKEIPTHNATNPKMILGNSETLGGADLERL
jgi:hypothetical protein